MSSSSITESIAVTAGLPPEEGYKTPEGGYTKSQTLIPDYSKSINLSEHLKKIIAAITTLCYKILHLPTKNEWHLTLLKDNKNFSLSFTSELEQKHIKSLHKLASRGLTIAAPIWDKDLIWSKALKNLRENNQPEDTILLVQKAIVNKKTIQSLMGTQNKPIIYLNCCLALLKMKQFPSYAIPNIEEILSRKDSFDIRLLNSIALETTSQYHKAIKQLKIASEQERKKEKINNENIIISLARTGTLLEKLKQSQKASSSFYQAATISNRENIMSSLQVIDILLHSGTLALENKNTELSLKACKNASKLIKKHKIDSYHRNIKLNRILSSSFIIKKNWKRAERHSRENVKITKENNLQDSLLSELQILINIQTMAKWWGLALISTKVFRKVALQNQRHKLAIIAGIMSSRLYEKQKLWDKACKILKTVKSEAYQQDEYIILINILHKLATNYIRLGIYEEAQKTLNHSYSLSFSTKDRSELFQTNCHLFALLYIRTNNISSAEFWFERAKNNSNKINSKYASIVSNIGYLKFRQGKIKVAKDKWQKAHHIYRVNNNLDKIRHMEQVIYRLSSGKPSVNSLGIKVDTPGPILTEPGKIAKVSSKLPNYKISNFSL